MTRRFVGRVALLGALIAASGCAPEAPEPVVDAPAATAVQVADAREPGSLAAVQSVPVSDRIGPGEQPFEVARRTPDAPAHLARRFGTREFALGLRVRRPDLTQYPCASCHLGRELALGVDRIADAHLDIQPVHPAETGATCGTCHAPSDIANLVLFSGETISVDHAYRLCAQCHFSQLEAWAGGAHGKRLDGWQGRRVVMGCADCHDPHSPATEPRAPYPGPILPNRAQGH